MKPMNVAVYVLLWAVAGCAGVDSKGIGAHNVDMRTIDTHNITIPIYHKDF